MHVKTTCCRFKLEQIREVLSKNLIFYRNIKGLNRSELARAAGVNLQSYQEWEKCEAWPGPDKLELLAIFHEIPSSRFFTEETRIVATPQEAINILQALVDSISK